MALEFTLRPAAAVTVVRYKAELTVWTGEQVTYDDGTTGGHVYVNVWCLHEHETPAVAEACRQRIQRFLKREGAAGLDKLESVGAAC